MYYIFNIKLLKYILKNTICNVRKYDENFTFNTSFNKDN